MNKMKKNIFVYILLCIIFILSILKIYYCPLKYFFGLSCPTCGLTRAILYALQFNFSKAFYYHLFWPFVIIGFIIYLLYDFKIIKINKKYLLFISIIICFLNLIYYFYRLFNGSSIVYFDFTESLIYKILNL